MYFRLFTLKCILDLYLLEDPPKIPHKVIGGLLLRYYFINVVITRENCSY